MPTRTTAVHGRERLLARVGGVAAVGEALGVYVLYLLLATASYRFAFSPELEIAMSWAPSGLALAMLVRREKRRWPLLLAAIGLAVASTLTLRGLPAPRVAIFATADMVEPFVAATLIQRAMPTTGLSLLRTREVHLLLLCGALAGPLAGTAVAVTGTTLLGGLGPAPPFFLGLGWWASAALGALDFGPLLLAAFATSSVPRWRRILEAFLIGVPIVALTAFGFLADDFVLQIFALVTAAYPLLALAAIRFGPAGAAWGSAITSYMAIYFTLSGSGPFAAQGLMEAHVEVVLVEGFFVLASVSVFYIAALTEERRRAFLVQQALADVGFALAALEPQESRLQNALECAVGVFGDAGVVWRGEEGQPAAFARSPGARPIAQELTGLAAERPARPVQHCAPDRCWLLVPLRGAADAQGGLLALRATRSRRYFDRGEVDFVENFAYRLALTLERDRLVGEADRLYREAAEAVHLRDQFLSIASHELKTPLTPLAARLELMKRRVLAGQEVDASAIEKAQASLGKLTWLINDLLDVSRIQSGRLELQRRPTSLEEVIRTVIGSVRPEDVDRIRFVPPAQELVVDGDRNRLEQVVENLLDNALKYSPSDLEVLVLLRQSGEEAVISVIDRGLGIPVEQKLHLFERFFRARNVSPTRYGGLGLGLYIVRDIVERHGGRIWAQSEEGRGSAFHVSLPLLRVGASPSVHEGGASIH